MHRQETPQPAGYKCQLLVLKKDTEWKFLFEMLQPRLDKLADL